MGGQAIWESVVVSYFFPVLLIVCGLFVLVVGLAGLEKRPDQKSTELKSDSKKNDQTAKASIKFKVGPLEFEFPRPVIPVWVCVTLVVMGSLLIVIGLVLIAMSIYPPKLSSVRASPSLLSMRYVVDDFGPLMVDLRRAPDSGIPVRAGQGLRLFDFWVAVPQSVQGHTLGIDIFAGDERIGGIVPKYVDAGVLPWDDVKIEKYDHAEHEGHWTVQKGWKELEVALVVRDGDVVIGENRTQVRLNEDGEAWMVDPPNLGFAAIVYSINDGPEIVLDRRQAHQEGLGVEPGDTLQIREVWYNSNAASQEMVSIEAFFSSGAFDPDTNKESRAQQIEKGVHNLADISKLSWTVPENRKHLVIWLTRSNLNKAKGSVLDEMNVPLFGVELPGLVSRATAVAPTPMPTPTPHSTITPTYIALETSQGRYVAATRDGDQRLEALTTVINEWEEFTLIHVSNGKVAFKASHGHYVTAMAGEDRYLGAATTEIKEWEEFTLEYVGYGKFVIWTHLGACVTVRGEEQGWELAGETANPEECERFTLVLLGKTP